jgi:nucleoside-diphosphate-sugar epimerase
MRLLLTGATGFLGSAVLRRLLADESHAIAVLIRPRSDCWRIADLMSRVTPIEGTMETLAAAAPAIARFGPEGVVHLAWAGVSNRARNDPEQTNNLHNSLKLLRLSHRAGARHWLGLGSQAEYGPHAGPIREDAITRPTTLYGVTKLCCCLLTERLCAGWGLRFVWLRLFSAYGPGDHPAWMLPSLITGLLRGERPALTAGEQRWDYIYVTDAAEAVYQAAVSPKAAGVYNLGSGQVRTIRHIAERIREQIDPNLPLGFGEVPYRPDQVMHLQANIERLRQDLGWFPRVPLDLGLKQTVAWHRAPKALLGEMLKATGGIEDR